MSLGLRLRLRRGEDILDDNMRCSLAIILANRLTGPERVLYTNDRVDWTISLHTTRKRVGMTRAKCKYAVDCHYMQNMERTQMTKIMQ